MSERMQPFIMSAIRSITEQLVTRVSQADFDTETSPNSIDSASTTDRSTDAIVLDVNVAEAVNDGSFVFPDTETSSKSDWCVLSLFAFDSVREARIFRFRGRLRNDMSAQEFVETAYDQILMRKIDPDGSKIYPSLIENFQLSRRDVLKILASSAEASSLKTKVVIVPEPSSWLSNLGVVYDDDAAFPALLVKGRP